MMQENMPVSRIVLFGFVDDKAEDSWKWANS